MLEAKTNKTAQSPAAINIYFDCDVGVLLSAPASITIIDGGYPDVPEGGIGALSAAVPSEPSNLSFLLPSVNFLTLSNPEYPLNPNSFFKSSFSSKWFISF